MVGLVSGPVLARQESASELCRLHPAELAIRLRRLAQDAYQVVKDQHSTPSEAHEITRRIEELRMHAHRAGLFEIDRWLQKASEVVRAHEED